MIFNQVKSIECLSLIMRCLVQWSKEMSTEEMDYTTDAPAPAEGKDKELTRTGSHNSLNETLDTTLPPTTEYLVCSDHRCYAQSFC